MKTKEQNIYCDRNASILTVLGRGKSSFYRPPKKIKLFVKIKLKKNNREKYLTTNLHQSYQTILPIQTENHKVLITLTNIENKQINK